MNYKAYFGIKYYNDNRNKAEIDSIAAILRDDGIDTLCMARDVEKWGDVQLSPQILMKITFQEIDKSDFVILEMTEKGVGLGIEAGYAAAKGKPLIILTKKKHELSETMQGIADAVISYSQPEDIKCLAHNKALLRTLADRAAEP